MADANSSREALYTAIQEATEKTNEDFDPRYAAPILRDLAYAWRATYGGAQPASGMVSEFAAH